MTVSIAEIAYVNSQEALDKLKRVDDSLAKQLQRSAELNSKLRIGLQKAADRFETLGMPSDAFDCRRLLRDL